MPVRLLDKRAAILALIVLGIAFFWAILVYTVDEVRFATYAPEARTAAEAAIALGAFLGAFVLLLFPEYRAGKRMRWVAAAFVALGTGSLIYGLLPSLLGAHLDLNQSTWAWMVARSIALGALLIGLVPPAPPSPKRAILTAAIAAAALPGIAALTAPALPLLVRGEITASAIATASTQLPGLTAWHGTLSITLLLLAIAAVVAKVVHSRHEPLDRWLAVALAFLVASQLHNIFWPSAYSPILATSDLLRLCFVATVTFGSIFELKRIATDRANLLELEQEHSRRLSELAVLKADFTAVVAHELGSPLAAIRGYTAMIGTGELGALEQKRILAAIDGQITALNSLIADVQTSASVERDDFSLQLRPVMAKVLLADAQAFAVTLPGDHPITIRNGVLESVRADPERIGQVFRNLLSNAAKYSPEGSAIEIRAMSWNDLVRFEVADTGYGVYPDDTERIFEKFGRGRHGEGVPAEGIGLGLYLSRRIIRAHGSDLVVSSAPGDGTVFSFVLEVCRDSSPSR